MWLPRIYFLIGLFSIRRFRIVQSNETCQRNHERSCVPFGLIGWNGKTKFFFFLPLSYSRRHTKQTLIEVFFMARMQSLFQIYTSFGWLYASHKHVECWIEEYIILQFIIRRSKGELNWDKSFLVFSPVEVVIHKGIDIS